MQIFQDLEDAVMNALEPLKISRIIKSLNLYDGQLEGSYDELMNLAGQFPAVYVTTEEMQCVVENKLNFGTPSLTIFVGDNALRGDDATRTTAYKTGLYPAMQQIFETIKKQKILTVPGDWQKLRLHAVKPVVRIPKINFWVYAMNYKMKGII